MIRTIWDMLARLVVQSANGWEWLASELGPIWEATFGRLFRVRFFGVLGLAWVSVRFAVTGVGMIIDRIEEMLAASESYAVAVAPIASDVLARINVVVPVDEALRLIAYLAALWSSTLAVFWALKLYEMIPLKST